MNLKTELTKIGVQLSKKQPEIAIVGGIGLLLTGTILACRATLKSTDILEKHRKQMEDVEKTIDLASEEEYTTEDAEHDKKIIYVKTAFEFAKVYAPSIIVTVGGVCSIIYGKKILNNRIAIITGAYKASETAFKEYRERVKKELGEIKEKEIKRGLSEEVEIDDNGDAKIKREVSGTHTRWWDKNCGSPLFESRPDYNKMALQQTQDYLNNKLRINKHLFVNEVWDALHLSRTQEGAVEGWLYDENNSELNNFIDFGLYDDINRDFVNSESNHMLIDLNPDGYIVDSI